jgi:sigma-B regulation protein RsbU (phosphoserine phosphatase)
MSPRSGVDDLRLLFEASRRLNQALELDRLLEVVRDICLGAVGAEACTLLLWNDKRTRLDFQMAYNRITPEVRELSLAPGEGMAGWISEYRVPAISNDVDHDPRFRHQIDREIGFTTRNLLAVPIFRGPTVIGVLELHNKRGPEGFTAEEVRLTEALVDQVAVALDNAILFRSLRREKAENEALYRISLLMNERLPLEEILGPFLDHVAEVVPYQAGAFYLVHQEAKELEWFTQRGYPAGTGEQVRLKLGQGLVGWVAGAGEPLVIPDVRRETRYLAARPETRSEVVVPIISESRVIGVFNLESDRLNAFRGADLRVLRAFANQAAISIQRAWFYRQLREKHRLEDEMRFARVIQELFLPEEGAVLPGFDLAGLNLPSQAVSGDFYDYIRITDGQFGVMIGDVSGKGAPAALIMATLRASLRAEIRNRYAIAEILSKVNYLLWESTEPERFATAVYGVLDLKRRVLTYANAGHNPPLRLDKSGHASWLSEGGLVLGPFPDSTYDETVLTLAAGDVLLLYTDGVTEAADPDGEQFGPERLVEVARDNRRRPAAEICRELVARVRAHTGLETPEDDLTVVVLRVL